MLSAGPSTEDRHVVEILTKTILSAGLFEGKEVTLGSLHFGLRMPILALLGGSSKVTCASRGQKRQVARMKRTAIPFARSPATGLPR